MAETILKELRGNVNEMAGEDLELKSLAKKMIPTLKKLGFEVEYIEYFFGCASGIKGKKIK